MSVIDDEKPTEPRARKPRATTGRTRRTGHRKITPPNRVEPGWIHTLAAGITLRALQGADIEAGEIDDDLIRGIPGQEDSPEPAELLARVYAHLMWRVPVLRSVAKRLEGSEQKAGLGSDLLALTLALWLRNRDLISAFRAAQRRALADELADGHKQGRVFVFRKQANNSGAKTSGERGAQ